ncbi:MAG: DinB family protein [Chlorobi bacterium]|nr:DinB family protein [Chlorobiota bacterium]
MAERVTLSKEHLAFGDLEEELVATRRVLESIPEDKFDWKPHEKSFSLGTLAFHVTNLLLWQQVSLTEDGFDLANSPPPETSGNLPGKDDLLKMFDAKAVALRAALAGTGEERLGEPWTLWHGENKIFTSPKADVLRRFGISHMVHHRGQLTLYLRLLDVPVPQTYGPTADEQ